MDTWHLTMTRLVYVQIFFKICRFIAEAVSFDEQKICHYHNKALGAWARVF